MHEEQRILPVVGDFKMQMNNLQNMRDAGCNDSDDL